MHELGRNGEKKSKQLADPHVNVLTF